MGTSVERGVRRAFLAQRRGNMAFGLIGLLVVMAIILVLMVGINGSGGSLTAANTTRKQGKEMAQEIATQQLSILIAQYRQENNKLPASPADLESPGAFNDPWGQEMTFGFETVRGKTRVTYKSKGPDGEANTEDDVTRTDELPF